MLESALDDVEDQCAQLLILSAQVQLFYDNQCQS